MGLIKSSMTLCIGYYLIDLLKKHKNTIMKIPFISDILKKTKGDDKTISNEVYILLFLLSIKDFIF